MSTAKKRKDGRWESTFVYTDPQGKRRRHHVYAKTKAELTEKMQHARSLVADGAPLTESELTVSAWIDLWVAGTLPTLGKCDSTVEQNERLLRVHVVKAIGDVPLKTLTAQHVEQMLLGINRSGSTKRQVMLLLRQVLDTAVERSLVRRNVARLVKTPRTTRPEPVTYTAEQVSALLAQAEGQRLAPMLRLIAMTGVRKGEAIGLRWQDVDLDTATIRITGSVSRVNGNLRRGEPKTKAGRRSIPLMPDVIDALREWKTRQAKDRLAAGPAWQDSDYVFTTELGTALDPRNVLRWFTTKVRNPAGIIEGGLHSFRHAAATHLLVQGAPMIVVRDVLGHSSIEVTADMYGHVAPDALAEHVRRGLDGYGSKRTV